MGENRLKITQTVEEQLRQKRGVTEILEETRINSLSGYLNLIMGRRGISADALAELSVLNRASLYRILNGSTKRPHRNALLRIALTLELDLEEVQLLLKRAMCAQLTGSIPRDIIIMDGIIHRRGIDEINRRLTKHRQSDLYARD